MVVRLTSRRLSWSAAVRALEGPALGGVVLFAGRVRPDLRGSRRVTALFYETHGALARRRLLEIERRARRRFGARRVVLWHRFGRVPAGEVSVIVGAACGHRAQAFAAARYLIEEVKASAPIWKTERGPRVRRPRRPLSRPSERSAD